MPNDNAIKLGILKCRDLVELYYGARMVVAIKQSAPALPGNAVTQILSVNPARIRYEIVMENAGATLATVDLGEEKDFGSGQILEYSILPGGTEVRDRSFFDDFEGVTLAQFVQVSSADIGVTVRETILTPIPVDEMP